MFRHMAVLALALSLVWIAPAAAPGEQASRIVTWNAYSIQFIDPPIF